MHAPMLFRGVGLRGLVAISTERKVPLFEVPLFGFGSKVGRVGHCRASVGPTVNSNQFSTQSCHNFTNNFERKKESLRRGFMLSICAFLLLAHAADSLLHGYLAFGSNSSFPMHSIDLDTRIPFESLETTGLIQVSCGSTHSFRRRPFLFFKNDSEPVDREGIGPFFFAAGNNRHRQLCTDLSQTSGDWIPVADDSAQIWMMIAGKSHSIVIGADGLSIGCCGSNAFGQCGLGVVSSTWLSFPNPSLRQFTSQIDRVVLGDLHTVLLGGIFFPMSLKYIFFSSR